MKRALFCSDLHARPDEPQREEHFKYFLKKEVVSCDRLYLMGDIFEFGFVFRERVLPGYESLVGELTRLVKNGIEVFFLAGNHDFWMSEYLRKKGFRIVQDGEVYEILGRKVQLFHGLLRQPDALSRFALRIMQNPTSVWLYSLLPCGLGFNLALKAAHLSRERHTTFPGSIKVSRLKRTDPSAEIIISGHHHEPFRFTYKGQDFYCVGDWIRRFAYLEMTPGGLELKTFGVDALLDKPGKA